MGVKISCDYLGDLRVRATHGPSGVELITDAPVDNQGKGESFSPTDLVATALAACIQTILGIQARGLGLDFRGMRIDVEKHMTAEPPRRIARLPVTITFDRRLSDDDAKALEAAAHGCPVHRSLHADIESPIRFVFPES